MRHTVRLDLILALGAIAALGFGRAAGSAYAACKDCPASALRSAVPTAVPHATRGLGSGWLAGAPWPTGPEYGSWPAGGYEARIGSPYYYRASSDGSAFPEDWRSVSAIPRGYRFASPPQPPTTADPYTYHFGPGFHRHSDYGHYRFPYYSYRRPWYFPGPPSWNRDTNFVW